jgi:hypothetical protein
VWKVSQLNLKQIIGLIMKSGADDYMDFVVFIFLMDNANNFQKNHANNIEGSEQSEVVIGKLRDDLQAFSESLTADSPTFPTKYIIFYAILLVVIQIFLMRNDYGSYRNFYVENWLENGMWCQALSTILLFWVTTIINNVVTFCRMPCCYGHLIVDSCYIFCCSFLCCTALLQVLLR